MSTEARTGIRSGRMNPPYEDDPGEDGSYSGISAIDRALVVLESLAEAPHGLSVTELSAHLRINKGLTHRILVSLTARDYVMKDPATQRYQITIRLLGLAFRHLRVLDIYDVILPILRKLAQESGELAELNWVEGDRLVTVAKADSPRQLRVVSYLGEEQVLNATAAGKVWLASLPETEALQRAVAAGLEALTDHTITSIAGLQTELAQVRERGYATNVRESGADVIAIAAPVRSLSEGHRVVGSVGVVAPAFRAVHTDQRLVQLVIDAARAVSETWPFVNLDG